MDAAGGSEERAGLSAVPRTHGTKRGAPDPPLSPGPRGLQGIARVSSEWGNVFAL